MARALISVALGEEKMSDHYESDYHLWCMEQARLLRELRHSREVGALDVVHAAEEMDALALRERDQLRNYLAALMAHRLVCDYEYSDRTRERHWRSQIHQQQHNVQTWLDESPSLLAFVPEALEDAYQSAWIFAGTINEGSLEYDFPPHCPYTFEQLMERNEST